MMTAKLALISFTIFAAYLVPVCAELRVWTDANGKTIEAEHLRTLTDQVVLRQADGSVIRISLDTLSERGRRYAVDLTPPHLDMSVSQKNSSSVSSGKADHGLGLHIADETITVAATIKKRSLAPYEAPLRAELFLLGTGGQKGGYIILDKSTDRMRFTPGNGTSHTFTSNEVSLQQFEYHENQGVQYEGYLLVIFDKVGDAISLKCSRLAFEKNAAAILDSEKGTVFDGKFNEVGEKRERSVNESVQKPKKRFFRRF